MASPIGCSEATWSCTRASWDHPDESGGFSEIAHTLAGPLFSLAQGFVVALLVGKMRARPRLRLFLLWLAYHGFMNFVGHVFTTGVAPAGDMDKVFTLLGAPWWLKLAVTGLGFVGLRSMVRPLAGVYADLAAAPLEDEAAAKAWSWELGLGPGILATPVEVLAALPVPAWIALVYNFAAALPFFDLPDALVKVRARGATTPLPAPQPWVPWLVDFAILALVRLVMDPGVGL